jgi:hypothetical protein
MSFFATDGARLPKPSHTFALDLLRVSECLLSPSLDCRFAPSVGGETLREHLLDAPRRKKLRMLARKGPPTTRDEAFEPTSTPRTTLGSHARMRS